MSDDDFKNQPLYVKMEGLMRTVFIHYKETTKDNLTFENSVPTIDQLMMTDDSDEYQIEAHYTRIILECLLLIEKNEPKTLVQVTRSMQQLLKNPHLTNGLIGLIHIESPNLKQQLLALINLNKYAIKRMTRCIPLRGTYAMIGLDTLMTCLINSVWLGLRQYRFVFDKQSREMAPQLISQG